MIVCGGRAPAAASHPGAGMAWGYQAPAGGVRSTEEPRGHGKEPPR